MAGRRKGRIRKRVLTFMVTLSVVMLAGLAVMTVRYGMKLSSEAQAENKGAALEGENVILWQTESQTDASVDEEAGISDISDIYISNPDTFGVSVDEERYFEAVEQGQNVMLVDCADDESIKLAFAGDILLDDDYAMMANFRIRGSSVADAFSESLLGKMRSADVFMLNNEFTFTSRGAPTEEKQFTFRSKPENVEILHQLGVDLVSLANNHAYDYGEVSLLDTMETLRNADIPYVGAGADLEEAIKPVYLVANGMKIAIVSATQIERNGTPDTKGATQNSAGVLRCMDPANLLSAIAEAEGNSDFTILYIHWGTENQEETDWLQDQQAPIYAQAGVDLIIGDHPHCLQKLDAVSGVPVIYSLGNYWFNSKTLNTCLIEVSLKEGKMEYFKFIPCLQSDCRTKELTGSEKEGVLNYMRSISPNVQIDSEGYVTF